MTEEPETKIEVTEPEAPSEVAAVNGADVWPRVLPLRKPIKAYGNELKELKFREPTGKDIDAAGNPVLFALYENIPKIHFEAKAMTEMMSRLANVPRSAIEQMHPKDWNNAAWVLAGFFTPDL